MSIRKGKKEKGRRKQKGGVGLGGGESLTLTFSGPPSSCGNFEVVIIHLCEPTNPLLAWQQGDFCTRHALPKENGMSPLPECPASLLFLLLP